MNFEERRFVVHQRHLKFDYVSSRRGDLEPKYARLLDRLPLDLTKMSLVTSSPLCLVYHSIERPLFTDPLMKPVVRKNGRSVYVVPLLADGEVHLVKIIQYEKRRAVEHALVFQFINSCLRSELRRLDALIVQSVRRICKS